MHFQIAVAVSIAGTAAVAVAVGANVVFSLIASFADNVKLLNHVQIMMQYVPLIKAIKYEHTT